MCLVEAHGSMRVWHCRMGELAVELNGLATILALFFLHTIIPGPAMLCLCTCASRGGRAAAVSYSVGTALGSTIWAAVVALGLWQLLANAPAIREALQWGAGFLLLVFGALAIFSAIKPRQIQQVARPQRNGSALVQGLLVSLTNTHEFVFWTAALALGAGTAFDTVSVTLMIIGVGVLALSFDLTLAYLASGGVILRLLVRLRRMLEISLAGAFSVIGAGLIHAVW